MSLNLDMGKELIEVVSSKDGSVTCDAEAYKEYLKTLDETLLGLKEGSEPTRFVIKKVLPYNMVQKIKTDQASVGDDGKLQIRMGYMLDEMRAALVNVKNPGSDLIVFKKDSDGYAARELIVTLESAGVLPELFAARQKAIENSSGPSKKS